MFGAGCAVNHHPLNGDLCVVTTLVTTGSIGTKAGPAFSGICIDGRYPSCTFTSCVNLGCSPVTAQLLYARCALPVPKNQF